MDEASEVSADTLKQRIEEAKKALKEIKADETLGKTRKTLLAEVCMCPFRKSTAAEGVFIKIGIMLLFCCLACRLIYGTIRLCHFCLYVSMSQEV